jgi:hypothetical protein
MNCGCGATVDPGVISMPGGRDIVVRAGLDVVVTFNEGAEGRGGVLTVVALTPGGTTEVVNVVLPRVLVGSLVCSNKELPRGSPLEGMISTPDGEALTICDESI